MYAGKTELILAAAPGEMTAAKAWGLTLAHMAYRIGGGPHLFRASLPVPIRGGLMLVDDRGFDGKGEPEGFCREVVRECVTRGCRGVICDLEGESPLLGQITTDLGPLLDRQGKTLYVTENYGARSPCAHVLISSAISGGTLEQRLGEAAERYGPERVVLAVERAAEDFYLPSPTGRGVPLSREELKKRMEERAPTVFFSRELCARYFTYMNPHSGAHFVLFDDAETIRRKLRVAERAGITRALLVYPEVEDLLGEILI